MHSKTDEKDDANGFAATETAMRLERSQITKYHTKTGHGFAAEDANAFSDKIRLRKVEVTGTSNEANGPDRIVNGVKIQTKYYQTPQGTVDSAFNKETGHYRYKDQLLEVPKDQYDDCLRIMREKILAGKVPGVTDPNQADKIVKEGCVNYKQARNIARAGNIDSIIFDGKTQAVTTSYEFAVTFVISFAKNKWNGEKDAEASRNSLINALKSGGKTFISGVISAQVLRKQVGTQKGKQFAAALSHMPYGKKCVELLAHASGGKPVYGGAAVNHVGKLFRNNFVTSTVTLCVDSVQDFYMAAVSKEISWAQYTKNFVVNAGGTVGGSAGALGGAALGVTAGVPLIGQQAGGYGGKKAGTAVAKYTMDQLIDDDAERMHLILRDTVVEMIGVYGFYELEIEELSETVNTTVNPEWLRSMYQAGAKHDSDELRRGFVYNAFEETCLDILGRRRTKLEEAANHMADLLQVAIEELANDYLLSDPEATLLFEKVRNTATPAWLGTMYQIGYEPNPDVLRHQFAYNAFDETCQTIVRKRERIELPDPELVQSQIDLIAESVLSEESMPDPVIAVAIPKP